MGLSLVEDQPHAPVGIYIYVVWVVSVRYITSGSGPQFTATPIISLFYTSPCPHNKQSNVQLQFFSLSFSFSLSVQITAAGHAIETDCGVGVAAVGNSCRDILVMFDDPASKSDNTVS